MSKLVATMIGTQRIHGYCGLCIARCGTIATVEEGRFTRLDPDPSHPTGQALCAKGRAAPELVYHKDRLTQPLRRTRPKGDPDPGWVAISWDEALDATARAMRRIADQDGPHAVAFSQSSPSTTAIAESGPFVRRLMNAFGTPNQVMPLDLCGWGRAFATRFAYGVATVGTGSAGGAMPDIANAGCLILWGYNPSYSRITHATATVEALKRGMKLIVIDPRRVGLANKADLWLRVRPGTDGALALGLANLMIQRSWFDASFVRAWSNGPHLVRSDRGTLLRASELAEGGNDHHYVAWDDATSRPIAYDPAIGSYDEPGDHLALSGEYTVACTDGLVVCRPVFDHYAQLCRTWTPERVEATCWIPREQLEDAARMLWHARPVSYYAWSGHEQHGNATETARAMALLYALTGSFDSAGGNVLLPSIPASPMTGEDLPGVSTMAPAVGATERPIGPARWNTVSAQDFYRAVLEKTPYPIRALIGFGHNLLLAQADPAGGRAALQALDFYAHADLFMTPTAALADIILPVASCFERDALKIGFEITATAQSLVQYRHAVVPPPGAARSDTAIIFDLARRLGLSKQLFDGDVETAYRHQLQPSGIKLEDLRAEPRGIRVPLTTTYTKHALPDSNGNARGFPTPSRKIEFWSDTLRKSGYGALPAFVEPEIGPITQAALASRFPLVLTCAKPTAFCQSQHRALPSLRKRALDPEIEIHPHAAIERQIEAGDWVSVETPAGGMRARARFNEHLDPRVVVGEHGWWQDCHELGAAGYDPFSAGGANYNLTVDPSVRDPISGTPAHRANLCQIRRIDR